MREYIVYILDLVIYLLIDLLSAIEQGLSFGLPSEYIHLFYELVTY